MREGLSIDELRSLSKLSGWRTVFGIGSTWMLIAATAGIVHRWPHPVVYAAAIVFMARHQLSLGILMHDGAHRRLFSNRTLNDWVGQFLCSGPILVSQDAYRKLHLRHHKQPMSDRDPDLGIIGGYPVSPTSFARKLFRDATGQTYFKFVGYFLSRLFSGKGGAFRRPESAKPDEGEIEKTISSQQAGKRMPIWSILLSFIATQAMLAWAFTALVGPWGYPILWLFPQLTVLQILLRIRGIAEHAGYPPGDDQALLSRTVVNPWQTFFFAPNHVGYHIEHHLYPSVPWYRLPRLHRILKAREVLPMDHVYPGYGPVLRELVKRPRR